MSSAPAPRPADGLRHPAVQVALVVLIVNDHYLKANHPSWATGKLSDIAGLVVAPVLLLSVIETAVWVFKASPIDRLRTLHRCSAAVGLAFAAIQVIPAATDLYAASAGWTSYAVSLVVPWFESTRSSAAVIADPTDLVALLFLPSVLLCFHKLARLIGTPKSEQSGAAVIP
jgi:hypothetical protein